MLALAMPLSTFGKMKGQAHRISRKADSFYHLTDQINAWTESKKMKINTKKAETMIISIM